VNTITLERGSVAVWDLADSPRLVAEVLDRGGVLAVPTGSSYALAADPTHAAGVGLIYEIKQRPPSEPLPVVVGDPSRLEELGVSCESGLGGLESAWPGALTVVLPCNPGIPAAAGKASLAVRVPGDRRLRELLSKLGRPLTATSANQTGGVPLTNPAALQTLLSGHDAVIVNAGPCVGGAPSTLVRFDGESAQVLRTGRISVSRLREMAPGLEIRNAPGSASRKPGTEGAS